MLGMSQSLVRTIDCSVASLVTSSQAPAPPEQFLQPVTCVASTSNHDKCIKLGNNKLIHFSECEVPDPPFVSFAKDLRRLMRMWDDTSAEWNPAEAVLHIKKEPIAVKYWKSVYSYGKPGHWGGIKKNWAHWRVSACIFFHDT